MSFQVKYLCIKSYYPGNSLAVQWLGLHASTSRGMGLIPDRGTKIPHGAAQIDRFYQKTTTKTEGRMKSVRSSCKALDWIQTTTVIITTNQTNSTNVGWEEGGQGAGEEFPCCEKSNT